MFDPLSGKIADRATDAYDLSDLPKVSPDISDQPRPVQQERQEGIIEIVPF